MLNYNDIRALIQEGKTNDEIAELAAKELNKTIEKSREEYEEAIAKEQEKKEEAAALDQARDTLVDTLINYFKLQGIEMKGNVKKTFTDLLKATEDGSMDSLLTPTKLFKYLW